jgi:hypothetical protein
MSLRHLEHLRRLSDMHQPTVDSSQNYQSCLFLLCQCDVLPHVWRVTESLNN